MAEEHAHRWKGAGFETIGGVLFRIDSCRLPGCGERRASRVLTNRRSAVVDQGRKVGDDR